MTSIFIVTKKRFMKTRPEDDNRRLDTDVVLGCYRSIDAARERLERETKGYLIVTPGFEYDLNDGTRIVDNFECLSKSSDYVRILFKRSGTIYEWKIQYSSLDD